jgi:hypothetical protein
MARWMSQLPAMAQWLKAKYPVDEGARDFEPTQSSPRSQNKALLATLTVDVLHHDRPEGRQTMTHNRTARLRAIIASVLLTVGMWPSIAERLLAQQSKAAGARAATGTTGRPEDTEVWEPVPKVVTPGANNSDAPSDAIVLFNGKNLDEWVSVRDKAPATWIVANGVFTVRKESGNIETKRKFKNYQLHIEWRIPSVISGSGQERGNSGVFLASTGPGNIGYELQILDSYQNKTYVNGQAGSLYKQYPPLVNATRKPGDWQTYDVVWTAPAFNANGALKGQ